MTHTHMFTTIRNNHFFQPHVWYTGQEGLTHLYRLISPKMRISSYFFYKLGSVQLKRKLRVD